MRLVRVVVGRVRTGFVSGGRINVIVVGGDGGNGGVVLQGDGPDERSGLRKGGQMPRVGESRQRAVNVGGLGEVGGGREGQVV